MKRCYFLTLCFCASPQVAMAQIPSAPMLTIAPKGPVVSLNVGESVEQAPDIAILHISLITRNRETPAAVAANNAGLAKLKTALMAKGVLASDIKQGGLSAHDEFEGEGGARHRKGFMIENYIQVKLLKLDGLNDVMGAAVAAGATSTGNLQFDVANKSAIMDRLIAHATAQGRSRAMIHAQANGFSSVRLLSVTESEARMALFAPSAPRFMSREGETVPLDLTPRPVTISVSLAMAFELTN